MRQNILIVICTLMSACIACTTEDDNPEKESFITDYVTADSIVIESIEEGSIKFIFSGQHFNTGKEFEKICKRNNDIAFNRFYTEGARPALADTLVSIRVETLEDYNQDHKKGSDVSDQIECEYYTFDEYIRNGYKTPLNANGEEFIQRKEGEITKIIKLSEAKFHDSQIIKQDFTLRFTQQPEVVGKHKFKIIVTTASKTIENTFEYDFENNSIF